MAALMMLLLVLGVVDMPSELAEPYAAGMYSQVIQRVDSLLVAPHGYTVDYIARLHLWKGFALIGLGEKAMARAEFTVARELDPTISLDPREVSPKIIEEFRAVGVTVDSSHVTSPSPVYLLLEDKRPRAAMQSLILPGWGQWRLGRKTKAVALGSLALATASGWIISGAQMDRARDDYLNAPIDKISIRYEDYNRLYKIHQAVGYGMIAVWTAGVIDILIGPAHEVRVYASPHEAGLSVPLPD